MNTKFLTIIFILIGLVQLKATSQEPDLIIYDGKQYELITNPLKDYFEKNPEKLPLGGVDLSSLLRGYRATFEFKDNHLLVRDIEIPIDGKNKNLEWKSVINDIFPKSSDRNLYWFTGILTIPFGQIVDPLNIGYGTTYENYILLEIDSGKLNKTKNFTLKEYEKFKIKQFNQFKLTNQYKIEKEKLLKNYSLKFTNEYLKMWINEYSRKFLID